MRGPTAFLTVQEGCDKFCTFCVVPYTRGAEASRPAARVLAEARDLVARGVREITLLGQNVNAYHGEGEGGRDWTLARLIRALGGGGWSGSASATPPRTPTTWGRPDRGACRRAAADALSAPAGAVGQRTGS
jgi:hypothetical protein